MKGTQSIITDFNEGAIARTMVEAPAAELDQLYQEMFNGLVEAIPVATYNSFNFDAEPATPATGLIRQVITSQSADTVVPAGTVYSYVGGSVTYTVENDTTIKAGDTYADVLVKASVSGTIGNLAQNTQFTASPAVTGFVSAVNMAAFVSGADVETDDERLIRFNAYIDALARGTPAAIEYGAKTTKLYDSAGNVIERVVSAVVDEPYERDKTQPPALFSCYIHNGVGATSDALVTQTQQVIAGYKDSTGTKIPGWKAAGVHCDVNKATEVTINIGGALTALPGYDESDLATSANSVAYSYILGLGVGTAFQVSDLISKVKAIDGVDNYVPADVGAPAAPVLGSTAGGALADTVYYVAMTYVTPKGETIASTVSTLEVAANHLLTVKSPGVIAGITGWNLYIGTSAGTLQKQNSALLSIGTDYQEPVSGLVAGAAPPAQSTARLADIAAAQSEKFMPGTMGIA
ncbi:baseplate J/gp47 family protein [Paraburkholderia phenoliruptrix]|uniref:baseplate J/gp47 family protein n=1 Tax=Paraburkholderia phenoliruptrix TaxID=252970 RepID=UPI0034CED885